MSLKKFYPVQDLQARLETERARNKKIALADGGFDLIHIGHIRYLREAKETADILIVALNSDKSLKRLRGDEERSIIDEQGRIRIISSFEFVDYVTIFDEETVDRVLFTLKPDFLCRGSDYTRDTVPERETVESYGGSIAIVGGDNVPLSFEILRKILGLEMQKLKYSNIAILKLSSLGDIIHTLPAFSLLRKRYPHAKMSWLVEPSGAKLLENFRGIDEIVVVNLKIPTLLNKFKEVKRIISNYRKKFDLIFDFQGLLKSAVLSYLLKSEVIGFDKRNLREPLARLFYTKRAAVFDENNHVIYKNIHLVKSLGNSKSRPSDRNTPLKYPPLREIPCSRGFTHFLRENKLKEKKFMILNVGGGWETKLLDINQYIDIINGLKLKRTKGTKIVVLWGNERERETARTVSLETGAIMSIFFGFSDLIRFIKQSRLIITADTLPLHIADMVGTPSVGFFGPTSPQRNGSLLENSSAVYEDLSCNFCYKKKCGKMECIHKIDIDKMIQVIEKIDEQCS